MPAPMEDLQIVLYQTQHDSHAYIALVFLYISYMACLYQRSTSTPRNTVVRLAQSADETPVVPTKQFKPSLPRCQEPRTHKISFLFFCTVASVSLAASAAALLAAGRRENTWRSYSGKLQRFVDFCQVMVPQYGLPAVPALPARPDYVAAYVGYLREEGLAQARSALDLLRSSPEPSASLLAA